MQSELIPGKSQSQAQSTLAAQLSDAVAAVPDHSKPSSTKWRKVNLLLASAFGLPVEKVKTYFASELKQVSVRMTQAGVARDRPSLGLTLIGNDAPVERYVTTVKSYVKQPHPFAVIVVAKWTGTALVCHAAVARTGADLLPAVKEHFPGIAIFEVTAPSVLDTEETTHLPVEGARNPTPYDTEQFSMETGVPPTTAIAWSETLRRKGQVILQGPPGTGKTYIATRLAKLVAATTGGFTETVVFHSSYTYQDFVSGLAPQVDDQGRLTYTQLSGKLLQFSKRAQQRSPDALCVLVIDEINRADLSSVFGELMYALEYRGEPVTLANGPDNGLFVMPSNVLIVGTMNTADRSVASFDHALRRRFAFIRLEPDYAVVESQLTAAGLDASPLVDLLKDVNEQIKDPNYYLGVSFFVSAGSDLPALFDDIWSTEVYPYLEELFKGREELLQRFSAHAVRSRYLSAWDQGVDASV